MKGKGERIFDQVLIRLGLKKGIVDPRYDKSIKDYTEKLNEVSPGLVTEQGVLDLMALSIRSQRLLKQQRTISPPDLKLVDPPTPD